MDKVQSHDEETHSSGSGSGISDFSALENETDDFGRQLLQHHRDTQRMNALRGNQQAFRKARPKPRVADILDREERERELREAREQRGEAGIGSNEADPPVTVPREWGRKARKQPHWMRKIVEPSEADENENEENAFKSEDDAIIPHQTLYTGDLNWRTSTDEVRHPGDDTPPSMRRRRPSTPPSSLRHMNTTLKHVTDSDGDFTSASLLASTPAATRLPRKIDELTQREIENIERQGVTSRTLDQLGRRPLKGALRRTSSSNLREQAIADVMATSPTHIPRPVSAHGNSSSPTRIPRRRGNKENLPPNGEANGHGRSKSSEQVGLTEVNVQSVNIKTSQRPGNQRNDSMSLLRKLARVSSMSPSPARDKAAADLVASQSEKPQSATNRRPPSAESARSHRANDIAPTTKVTKQGEWDFKALQPEQHDNRGIARDYVEVKAEQVVDDPDRTPAPQDPAPEAKTPVVTGGWLDSTIQNGTSPPANATTQRLAVRPNPGRALESATRIVDENLRRIQSEPANHPKSALAAIIRDNQYHQNDVHFGESTIQSLEDIANPNLDATEPTITFDLANANGEDENIDAEGPLTQAEKDRRQENLAVEALNKHLRAARTSIKDASRGLRRVGNKVEAAQEGPTPTTNTATTTVITTHETYGKIHCDVCGGGYRSVWYALWAEFRSLFYIWDSSAKYGIRFTWLGLFCLYWLIWYISESTLCSIYCKPKYAWKPRHYTWNEPRYPFVIPTLIFRPFKPLWAPIWTPLCKAVREALEAFFHDILGDSHSDLLIPGVMSIRGASLARKTATATVRSKSEWIATASTTSTRVAQSVLDVVDEVGRMWDDELLL